LRPHPTENLRPGLALASCLLIPNCGSPLGLPVLRLVHVFIIDTFQRMNRLPVSSDQVDSYLLDIARRLPKPGERFRRIRLSDDQTSQLYSVCKEQLHRRSDRAGDQTPTSLWDAYNAVVEWVDREANALQGWERLRELWLSGIKDDALYEALMRIESDSVGNPSTRHS
jgi:hypothetical protein